MRTASHRAASVGLLAFVSSLALSVSVASAAQRPVVIPGLGPGDAVEATQPAPLPAIPSAPPVKGAYGGGFIEFLITGNSGGQPVSRPVVSSYAPPAYAPASPTYSNDAVAALPEPAPAREPDLAVRRDAPEPEFRRREVAYDGDQRPGTIIIDTPRKFLFLVEPGGRAIRYGIGVGRPGFEWSGVKKISRKAEWPGWTPPRQMLLRRPDLPAHMDGGLGNPLGARALYLGSSLYRIHGTNEPWTIGQNVSSGCIRMMNQDVIDLYNRVPVGARVVVL